VNDERLERGMEVRRAVLGDAHVDRAAAARTPLTAEWQDFLTRYAWGEIWTRPGLDRRTRSCITVAMLVALNREEELRLHLRAALNNGVTVEELKEVLHRRPSTVGSPQRTRLSGPPPRPSAKEQYPVTPIDGEPLGSRLVSSGPITSRVRRHRT
jgi:4-carboxymuconolactone decarboxylase